MSTINNFNNFDIPKGGYAAFDATSLRQLIIDRLNSKQVFTDQNYIGSNLASIIDIVAYSFNTLIYYLNRTASESMFTEAQLYENINRIVKLLDYNPIGYQTSTLSFSATVGKLNAGIYTIPRYSYVSVNNVKFSFNTEATFVKTLSGVTEGLDDLSNQTLLFQGSYQEYPIYTATGEGNELVLLSPPIGTNIDHFNVDVYVKPYTTGTWVQYTKTINLYLESSNAEKYEIRLNGNKQYEIVFGNDINGRKLQEGDVVALYYLKSDGTTGVIGQQALKNASPQIFNTAQFTQILSDVLNNSYLNSISNNDLSNVKITNYTASTPIQDVETADEIRENAPAIFRSQYRLINEADYTKFIKTNFANLISDVVVVNNWVYTTEYLQYFYDLGLTDPTMSSRALFNQIQFSDACNFNNVYLFVVPKTTDNITLSYLLPAQKELISTSIQPSKCMSAEIAYADPVYKAVAIGIYNIGDPFVVTDESVSRLYISKSPNSNRDNVAIVNDVVGVFKDYFDRTSITLGQTLDIKIITQKILEIDGVHTFYTGRVDSDVLFQGLSLFVWNPDYSTIDLTQTSNNMQFRLFEYPYLFDYNNLANKIVIQPTQTNKGFLGY